MAEIPVRRPRVGRVSLPKATLFVLMVVLVGSLVYLASSTFQVDVGEAAVVIDPFQGRIVDVVFGPAFKWKMPWQEVKIIPISVQTVLLEDGKALVAVTGMVLESLLKYRCAMRLGKSRMLLCGLSRSTQRTLMLGSRERL